MPKVWRLNKWYGGIATGTKFGIAGSYTFGKGLDFRTDPDLLQPHYALAKNSSTNVTGLVKWFAQNGTTIYAYADDGKIHSNASSWASLRTVASSTGQGLEIYNDYLYYTQNTQLGRYGPLSGAVAFTDNYQTGLTSDTLWHPCKVFLNKLYVGHGRNLGELDSTPTWTANKIQLPIDWKIKCLEVRGDFLYIGAWKGTAITDYEVGAIFAWDGTSTTWNSVEFINESGVNALFNQNDNLFVFAGTRGNVYQFLNSQYVKIKRIPKIGIGKYAEIFPGAVTGWNGNLHFGVAGNTDSATLEQGVYTWSQVEKNYPFVLNFDYPISTATTTGTTLQIGAVKSVSPTQFYVGWRDNTTYGIDLISTSTKQTAVPYESLIEDFGSPFRRKTFKDIVLTTEPLASGATITIKYKADRAAAFTTLGTMTFASDGAVSHKKITFANAGVLVKAYELQIRIELTAAQLIEANIFYDEDESIT